MTVACPHFTITPLGGLGEIGLNCQIWSTGDDTVLVDCGLMFPDDYHLGIDVVIPRFEHVLRERDTLRAVLLTHGHEDHIGALPWLVPHFDGLTIIGSRFTLALVEHKLRERDLLHHVVLQAVEPDEIVTFGAMKFQFLPVSHSIIEGRAIALDCPVGRIIHTGDFKLDPEPLEGIGTDLELFRNFAGEKGLRLLLSDSTNIECDGHSLKEREIKESFWHIFNEAQGRIVVTLFSSHIQRIQEVFDLAAEFGRTVVVNGRSLVNNIGLAHEHGFLRLPTSLHLDTMHLPPIADRDMVLLVTGSQGEPMSALARIVNGEHRNLNIHAGDTIAMSSRIIPGNARAITRLINQVYRLGAEVYFDKFRAIHASGHAHREELKSMLEATRPEYFVPVHGEYRHLVKHAALARECGVAADCTHILDNGLPITLYAEGDDCNDVSPEDYVVKARIEEPLHVESILVDGKGVGDVGHILLRERQILGDEGMVAVVMVIDEITWEVINGPEIFSRGFVFEQHFSHVIEDAKGIVLDIFDNLPAGSTERFQERIRASLRRFFRKSLERDPIIVPIITTL
ncbi:MAG: ribonuclease J [Pseudomonadota bacterium]